MSEVFALSLVGIDTSLACKMEPFSRMKELKYLLLEGCSMNDNSLGWLEELKWLQWRNYPHEELPQNLKLPNLALLDLANSLHLTRVWAQDFEMEVGNLYLIS